MFKFSKYICIFSLVVTLILFIQNVALAGGGFTQSCKNIQFTLFTRQGGFSPLTADCNTRTGEVRSGSFNFLDLNANITNNDGTLAWQKDGGFANSVNNCGLSVSNVTMLFCDATKMDGSVVNTSINLDDKIANNDGNLTIIDEEIAKAKYDLKVVTTTNFEDQHIAKDRDEALKKGRDRDGGGALLHYMKTTDLTPLQDTLKRKFSDSLSKEPFEEPKADIPPNNYWTGLKVTVWEYNKAKDTIEDKKVELCLGLINFKVNANKTVEVGVHHIQQVRYL